MQIPVTKSQSTVISLSIQKLALKLSVQANLMLRMEDMLVIDPTIRTDSWHAALHGRVIHTLSALTSQMPSKAAQSTLLLRGTGTRCCLSCALKQAAIASSQLQPDCLASSSDNVALTCKTLGMRPAGGKIQQAMTCKGFPIEHAHRTAGTPAQQMNLGMLRKAAQQILQNIEHPAMMSTGTDSRYIGHQAHLIAPVLQNSPSAMSGDLQSKQRVLHSAKSLLRSSMRSPAFWQYQSSLAHPLSPFKIDDHL